MSNISNNSFTGISGVLTNAQLPASPTFTGVVTGTQLTSNIAIGTPPLVVTSTTNVPNLNASSLSGATFAAPGAIGGGTPATGTFTTLTANTSLAINGGTAITAQSGTGGTITTTASPTFTGTVALPIATLSGKITNYNGIGTAGNGVSTVMAVTSQKSESALDTNVLTFTPPAATGTYRLSVVLSLSAASAAVLGWTATWKDSNAAAQSPTNLSFSQDGTALPALTFTAAGAGNYYGSAIIDTDASATNIVIKLTFTGTSFTGKMSATIERLQ